jgi:uncharacterized protein (TIGR03790 family)
MAAVFPLRPEPVSQRRRLPIVLWLGLFIAALPCVAQALEPSEILIIANQKAKKGVSLARYYARQRHIPDANLLLLNLPLAEVCSRKVYDRLIAAPVRAFLATIKPAWRIRCLVLMYGMPLKIASSHPPENEASKALKAREKTLKSLMEDREETSQPESSSAFADELEDVRKRLGQLKITSDEQASVDSELCIVRASAPPLGGWIKNPFYIGFRGHASIVSRNEVLMVSRLDGPSAADVKRIIDDSMWAEKNGLSGIAYFDARWPMGPGAPTSAYARYDRSIHRAAQQVEKSGRMPVVIEQTSALFQAGRCPDAALYCGWYSLATYVDAFTWKRGAVGFHIASSECSTLKKANSQVWCKRMIEKGICATLGPVGEPYVQAFPMPTLFFGFLTDGVLSLAECYTVSLPFLSWKMVLIGDPLYRPFKAGGD